MKTRISIFVLAIAVICVSFVSPAFAYFQGGLDCELTGEGLEPSAVKGNWWITSNWGVRAGYNWDEEDLYAALLYKERVGTWLTRYFGLGIGYLGEEEFSFADKLEVTAGLEGDLGKFIPGFSTALELRINPHSLGNSSDDGRSSHLSLTLNYRFLGSITDQDYYLLAKLITAEAQGEPYIGQVAVGAVVMNRVKSSIFPNTIREVIYQKNQFSCLPKLPNTTPTESALQAAEEALKGKDPSKGALYYYNPRLSSLEGLRFFATADIEKTVEIGNHIFFK